MRNTAALIIAALLGATSPAIARSTYPPGPPYRSCADTLRIFDVQQADTLLAPCHPATLDTVLGVRGVITAFDAFPSSYAFYIQNVAAPWSGVYVLTGATNYKGSVPGTPTGGNLALGDSVVIYGTTQEFPNPNGETEIEGPDAITSTNDILIRRISSGNPLPASHAATTHELNWLPAVSAATAEPWEGCFVRINGPLRVARTQRGFGVDAPNFLVVNQGSPSDSVLIDGATLFSYTTPPLGVLIEYVQGILNQRNSLAGSGTKNSYRIQLRNVDDIGADRPPTLTDAYPLADNKFRLVFDFKVDPVAAQSAANYHLASELSGSMVTAAALDLPDSDKVVLTVSSVLAHGDFETVSFENIGSKLCPLCTGTGQRDCYQGVLSVAEIQKPDATFLPLYDDRSRFAGAGTAPGGRLSFRGVSTQHFGSLYYLQDAAGGYRSGISVFGPSPTLASGHRYLIAGAVQEFGGETEFVNTVYVKDEGTATIPAPVLQTVDVLVDTTTDQSNGDVPGARITGEEYEGMLVRVEHVIVCAFSTPPRDPSPGGSFLVKNAVYTGTDTILVSNVVGTLTFDADTERVVNVAGVLHFSNGTFRIMPRSDADIELLTLDAGGPMARAISLSVTPNPGFTHDVAFVVPHRARVDLGVFDLSGRRIVTLAEGVMPAGAYSRTWDGHDRNGRLVGAGVFFHRLRVGNEERIARAVMLR